jgi:2-hydroxychromene-2-carboxylate isomerase
VSRLTRRVLPRAVVAAARVDAPARAGARVRRALGRRGRVELYFAFDDPCSAVAVVDLAQRLAFYEVTLAVRPVVARGIAGDPAVEQKRAFAITDARRLAARSGRTLTRTAPIAPEEVAFLARWVATTDTPSRALTAFCVAALSELWMASDGPVQRDAYMSLWRAAFDGADPPPPGDRDPVAGNERRMVRRRMYDTPAAHSHGRWWFAHDRPAQIAAWLQQLGWAR